MVRSKTKVSDYIICGLILNIRDSTKFDFGEEFVRLMISSCFFFSLSEKLEENHLTRLSKAQAKAPQKHEQKVSKSLENYFNTKYFLNPVPQSN